MASNRHTATSSWTAAKTAGDYDIRNLSHNSVVALVVASSAPEETYYGDVFIAPEGAEPIHAPTGESVYVKASGNDAVLGIIDAA